MLHTLPAEVQDRFEAYVTGINRYITEVVLLDPFNKMPAEFHTLGILPTPWSVTDVVAFGAFRNKGDAHVIFTYKIYNGRPSISRLTIFPQGSAIRRASHRRS